MEIGGREKKENLIYSFFKVFTQRKADDAQINHQTHSAFWNLLKDSVF